MQTVHAPIPSCALTRIRHQGLVVNDFQSCQNTFFWRASNYYDTDLYLATPGNECYVEIDDGNQILPYSRLQLFITTLAPIDPATWQPWLADLYIRADETTPTQAAAFLVIQINAFYRAMVARGYPAFKSMRARAVGPEIEFFQPWGLLGNGAYSGDGPMGPEAFTDGVPGVDNPLWFGIIGPKRHAFRVAPRYPGPYYGSYEERSPIG